MKIVFYLFLFQICFSKELNESQILQSKEVFHISIEDMNTIQLQDSQFSMIKELDNVGKAYSWNIELAEGTPKEALKLCFPTYQYLRIIRTPNSVFKLLDPVEQQLDDLSVDDLYISSNEKLISMVKLKNGILLASNIGKLYLFKIIQKSPYSFESQMVKNDTLVEVLYNTMNINYFRLVYDPQSDLVFAFTFTAVFCFKVTEESLKSNFREVQNLRNLGSFDQIIISNGLIFISQINDGIKVYKILPDGDAEKVKVLGPKDLYPSKAQPYISIADIKISGDQDQYLYVLDYRMGIQQFIIEKIDEGSDIDQFILLDVTFKLNEELGLIGMSQGFAFDILDNKTLIVLAEQKTRSITYEYFIQGNNWFEVNRQQSKGKLNNVVIGPEFGIIQGIDEHRIWFHSMYKEYFSQDFPDRSIFNNFYAGHVRQIELYKSKPTDHASVILAINDFEFLLFPFAVSDPQVWCNTITQDIDKLANQELKFYFKYNTTNCKQKEEGQNQSPLVYCSFNDKFTIVIIKALLTGGHYSILLLAAIIVASL